MSRRLVYRGLISVARDGGTDLGPVLSRFGLQHSDLSQQSTVGLTPEATDALVSALANEGDATLGLRAARHVSLDGVRPAIDGAKEKSGLSALLGAPSVYQLLLGDDVTCDRSSSAEGVTLELARAGAPLARVTITPQGEQLTLRVRFHGTGSAMLGDALGGVLLRLVRDQLPTVQLIAAKLQQPALGESEQANEEAWFQAPLEFSSEQLELVFADSNARSAVRARPSERAALPRDSSLIARAREHLSTQLDKGDFDLGSIAAKLGTSERTLRRRLRELGTGYRELIDEVRRERALMLAHEGAYNVTTIASQVGFADVTTFTRAFRRWTGTLPSNYMVQARSRAALQNRTGNNESAERSAE